MQPDRMLTIEGQVGDNEAQIKSLLKLADTVSLSHST